MQNFFRNTYDFLPATYAAIQASNKKRIQNAGGGLGFQRSGKRIPKRLAFQSS
jgi:hypothetical protein